jgi:uncharacterized protein DUF4398
MSLRASLLFTLVLLAFTSLACGGDPPDREIQQAQAAIDTARAAGADKYAAEEYAAAVTALANAKAAVEQRDYRLALNDALDSRERAETAAAQAAEGQAAARTAAERALAAAAAAVSAGGAKVKAAGTAHVPARTLADARTAVTDAEQRVQEARTAIRNADYDAAMTAAAAATQAIKAATDGIDAAAAPPGRRRPPRR